MMYLMKRASLTPVELVSIYYFTLIIEDLGGLYYTYDMTTTLESQLTQLKEQTLESIQSVGSTSDLDNIRLNILGKKGANVDSKRPKGFKSRRAVTCRV